jgi:ABC-type bacteriocin/lantibiotic exporter with double-glycine peptidase domain
MVLAYWGIERSEAEVRRVLGSRSFGTPSYAVERLSRWGMHVRYSEWSISQLIQFFGSRVPVIVFVRTAFLDHWQYDVAHAVVLVGCEENQRFWMHDPALPAGPTAVSWPGTLAAWAEFGYRGAAITRTQD